MFVILTHHNLDIILNVKKAHVELEREATSLLFGFLLIALSAITYLGLSYNVIFYPKNEVRSSDEWVFLSVGLMRMKPILVQCIP